MAQEPRKIWILAGPGAGLLNVSGAWEVFSHACDVLGEAAYSLSVLGPVGPVIETNHGLCIGNVQPLPKIVRSKPHAVIVAGGSAFTDPSPTNLLISAWLRKHAPRLGTLVSICAGAFTLGDAGLLDAKRVTTHWMALDRLRTRFPKAHVVDEGIYVRDGQLWTSAGITAGIDLCLALVECDYGHSVAMRVARRLVLFLRRTGNQSQFSEALQRQTPEPSPLSQFTGYVLDHVAEDLRVPRLARALGMSSRTLTRFCTSELGEAPAEAVRRLRLEEAARMLSATRRPLKAIAAASGLGDPSTLWRLFVSHYGITPEEYRARFSSLLQFPHESARGGDAWALGCSPH